ncbi:hypothetical protein BT63DRAFT_418783 [Microthyrium microscopicum]|uniref:FCP1 homology domain-containing protein n=1 Tax=Microthyrium microscopicum TaxID=703497 RepID=A0A6A6TV01_9PEZI|nr:hypothetical protein BT63DRAFT_418783 [Microthyrium microscopicum]
MNSLNILSTIAPTPPSSPPRSRSGSATDLTKENARSRTLKQETTDEAEHLSVKVEREGSVGAEENTVLSEAFNPPMDVNEQTPLLGETRHFGDIKSSGWRALPKRLSSAFIGTIRVVVTSLAAPFRYIIAWFYDEDGRFSPLFPLVTVYRVLKPCKKKVPLEPMSDFEKSESSRRSRDRNSSKPLPQKRTKRPPSVASSTTAIATDSEFDEKLGPQQTDDTTSRSRSSMSASGEEISPARRSIRIKLHNDEMIKRRRQQESTTPPPTKEDAKEAIAASLKSPSSPGSSKLTKFPRTPAPPRPLIPRRNPSYSNTISHGQHQKTLVLDLDETLIHSHSKGGRFAQGHMVEVKMQHAVGVGGTYIGPQIPILYYVHKRPHCDEFLRKVSKWYNLVIFTASVQEYADPVIDWLELEKSYFSARYYRQHCTHKNGAYVKDLVLIEPDLSKVMIVDNSPVSYVFHEDNAVPIEGWISDPTDNDLLNLIPILEGLQYVTDVRALLSLRLGQPHVDGS